MAISSVGSASSATNNLQANNLGIQDFLKILLTQLNYQDPMKPMDNQQFMAQMAQFTTLQQTQQLNTNIEHLINNQASLQSVGLIGRTVDIATQTGVKLIKQALNTELNKALLSLKNEPPHYVYITHENGQLRGVLSSEDFANELPTQSDIEAAFINIAPILNSTPINEVIGRVAVSPCPVPVIDKDNTYLGVISQRVLLETLDREGKE